MRTNKQSDTNFPLYTKCKEHIKIPTRFIVLKRLFDQVSKTLCGPRSVWEYQNYVPVPVSSITHYMHQVLYSTMEHAFWTDSLSLALVAELDMKGVVNVQRVAENNTYAELPGRPCHFPSASVPLVCSSFAEWDSETSVQPWSFECCRRKIPRKCSTLRIAFPQL
jgi:hypothetical protein